MDDSTSIPNMKKRKEREKFGGPLPLPKSGRAKTRDVRRGPSKGQRFWVRGWTRATEAFDRVQRVTDTKLNSQVSEVAYAVTTSGWGYMVSFQY
jgi:hypothetical protein